MFNKEKNLTFSIDRLSLVADFKFPDFFYQVYNYLIGHENSLIQRTNKNLFELSFTLDGLGMVQIDNPTHKLRLDFNPNNILLVGKKHFNYILSMVENIHFTRLDLAIDLFNYNISDYNIIDIGSRKSAYFYDRVGKLETLYSGSMKSDKFIRIYNKAVEQKLKNIDWWRFEIQIRGVHIDKYFTDLIDFYKDILIFKYNVIDEYSTEENAMIEYLLHDISRLDKIGKNQKTKYRNIIKQLKLTSIDFLDDIISTTNIRVIDWLDYITDYRLYPERDLIILK